MIKTHKPNELTPLPTLDKLQIPGKEMRFDYVLVIMSLKPNQLYTARQIAGEDVKLYRWLYSFIGNSNITPDGDKRIGKRVVNTYYGVSLMNEVPDRSRYRYLLYQQIEGYRQLAENTEPGLLGIERELMFNSLVNGSDEIRIALRLKIFRSITDKVKSIFSWLAPIQRYK